MLNKNINSQVLFMQGPQPPTPISELNLNPAQPGRDELLESIVNKPKLKKVDQSLIKDRSAPQNGPNKGSDEVAVQTHYSTQKKSTTTTTTQQTAGNNNLAAEVASKRNGLKSTGRNLWGKNDA